MVPKHLAIDPLSGDGFVFRSKRLNTSNHSSEMEANL
jgi:hypothetical protein